MCIYARYFWENVIHILRILIVDFSQPDAGLSGFINSEFLFQVFQKILRLKLENI